MLQSKEKKNVHQNNFEKYTENIHKYFALCI